MQHRFSHLSAGCPKDAASGRGSSDEFTGLPIFFHLSPHDSPYSARTWLTFPFVISKIYPCSHICSPIEHKSSHLRSIDGYFLALYQCLTGFKPLLPYPFTHAPISVHLSSHIRSPIRGLISHIYSPMLPYLFTLHPTTP